MKLLRLSALTLFLAASSGAYSASALTIDDNSHANQGGAANFGDPDDKIPYPHVADDGTSPSANFQAQPVGNSGVSFSITPAGGAGPADSAFQRAQDNMQK